VLQYLWLAGLALMFMPDINLSRPTDVGSLQPSDRVLLLLLPALLIGPGRAVRLPARVRTAFWLFLGVALLSVLASPLRYPDADSVMLYRGLTKLAKFAIYALIGPLVARRILSDDDYRRAVSALVVGGFIAACSLMLTAYQRWEPGGASFSKWDFLYQASNSLSVTLAALVCLLFGLWYTDAASPPKLVGRIAVLLALVIGLIITGGRGGWLAAAIGLAYVAATGRPTLRSVVMAVSVGVVAAGMAMTIPQVRGRIERISDPTTASQAVQQTGFSDEGRLYALTQELPKLWDAPIVGVGFFNRGDPTELDPTGSHNFFAQMALETGLLGLSILLWLFWGLWKVKSPPEFKRPLAAFHATVVVICVACLSGEYLYGGLNLMLLSVLYCSTIALVQRGAMRATVPIPSPTRAAVRSPAS